MWHPEIANDIEQLQSTTIFCWHMRAWELCQIVVLLAAPVRGPQSRCHHLTLACLINPLHALLHYMKSYVYVKSCM